jgi:hypothetical protein
MEWYIGKDIDGSYRGIIDVLPKYFSGEKGKLLNS